MGKYTGIVEKLPKLPGEDPGYQEKVNEEKARIIASLKDPTATTFALIYRDLRKKKDKLEVELEKPLNLKIAAIEQLMEDAYEHEGVEALRLEGGGSVSKQLEPSAQVTDSVAYRVWCIENGYAPLMQLHPSRTQSLLKERLVAGEDIPPGIKMFSRTKFVFRKQ